MTMKVWVFGILFVTLFTNTALSEETSKANFDTYEYRNGGNQDYGNQDSPKNTTERLEDLRTNADGIEIFLAVMEKVVANGGDTVKIPVEIDPEEHNISINDAFDRTDDFLAVQTVEAKDLLSDVYQSMQNLEYYSDSSHLEQTRDEIIAILKSFSDAKQDVVDYRQANLMSQMYDYYYDDTALENQNQTDNGDKDDEASVPTFKNTEVINDEINQDSDDDDDDENDEDNMDDANKDNLVLNVENDFNEEYDEVDLKNVTNEFEVTTGSGSVNHNDVTGRNSIISSPVHIFEKFVSKDSQFSQNQVVAKFAEDITVDETQYVFIEEKEDIDAVVIADDYAGNDATTSPDMANNEESTNTGGLGVKQFEAMLVEEDEDLYDENKPIYGNDSIDLTDVVPDEDLYDTKVEWEDSVKESEFDDEESNNIFLVGKFPVRVYIAVAVPLGLFLISIIAYAACWYGSCPRRSVTVRARSLTDSDRESRVSVVSICDSESKPIHPSVWAKLPSYLEVISEKVEPVSICDLKIPL